MTTIIVSSGTTVVSTPTTSEYIVEGSGTLDILNGGTVSGLITVSSGGSVNVSSGGEALSATISKGGTVEVLSSGTVDQFEVASGGKLVVFGLATTTSGFSAVASGGLEIISSGGTTTGGGVLSGFIAGTGLSGGRWTCLSGGTFSLLGSPPAAMSTCRGRYIQSSTVCRRQSEYILGGTAHNLRCRRAAH